MNAERALAEILFTKLNGASALWGQRVERLNTASAKMTRPYVVFFEVSSTTELVRSRVRGARITVSVKGVSENLATADQIDDAITALLKDAGDQDVNPRLATHASWRVLTLTEGRHIYIEEKALSAQSIYHMGHQYEAVMEER